MSRPAMIVCQEPLAAEEGWSVLADGGNAVDAALTCAFVQGVVNPQMCGIGGCGTMLFYQASSGDTQVVEFFSTAGERARPDQWEGLFVREAANRYGYLLEGNVNDCGYASVGVPAAVAGLDEALRRFGTRSWRDVVAPAVKYAREGFEVTGYVRDFWLTDYGPDVVAGAARLSWTEEARRIYTKAGELYGLGEIIRNEDLARTLERLAEYGAADFYTGEIAKAIVQDFERNGGSITASDLASCRARVTSPVRGRYRGWEVVTVPPPAGGLTLLQLLNFLETYDLKAASWPSTEVARARVAAMSFTFGEREQYLADPTFVDVNVDALTAKEYAAAARSIQDSPTTTHVCVVDGEGNAVSLTHTLGTSSGVITPGLGFLYNNYMNCFDPRPGRIHSIAPGKTRVTMMVPTLLFDSRTPRLVIGAPGGTRIVGGVFQTISNVVDHGMSPLEAIAAPRLDYQGETLETEYRVPGHIITALAADGFRVHRRPRSYDSYFSRVQAIGIDEEGRLRGASDPRGDGGIALDTVGHRSAR